MNRYSAPYRLLARLLIVATGVVLAAPAALAQVPVDENGNPIQAVDETTTPVAETAPVLLDAGALQALVGPIALYPDDLLAIVLPASTYPLEVVQAARFLEDHKTDSSLEPDDSWDESVTALLNYPEVVNMMNDDLDWTWRLGEAVINQQADVIAAVEVFRDRAYAAGNLKSDEYQTVTNDDGVIEIDPIDEEIIYVPYYEPERVVVYQPRPAYYYYPRPYPVYYYPYPYGYNFYANYFWGVTTAFSIGWATDHLHVFHHSYWGHPYYGRTYYPHWWYRRPSITVYNTWYVDNRVERTRDHYRNGDLWRPRHAGGARPGFHRSRTAHYRDARREHTDQGYRSRSSAADAGRTQFAPRDSRTDGRPAFRGDDRSRPSVRRDASADSAIRFRERDGRPVSAGAARQQPAVANNERDTAIVRRQAAERRPAVTERADRQVQQRSAPRSQAPNDDRRRVTGNTTRMRSDTDRRETTSRTAVSRAPAVRSQSRSTVRQSPSVRAPRASAPARVSAPRNVSRSAASAPRSVSRPAVSAPRAAASQAAPRQSSSPRRTERSSSDNQRVRHR